MNDSCFREMPCFKKEPSRLFFVGRFYRFSAMELGTGV